MQEASKQAAKTCPSDADDLQRQLCAGEILADLLSSGTKHLVQAKQNEWTNKFTYFLHSYKHFYLAKKEKNWAQLKDLFDSHNGFVQAIPFDTSLHQMPVIAMQNQPMYYVQNVPFSLYQNSPKRRQFGSEYGKELAHGKMIHKTWEDACQAACAKSVKSDKAIEVVIHQGYFSPTEGMIHDMNKLINEEICPNVKLKVYTNSIASTDLTPINFIGRRQLHALIKHNSNFNSEKFEYYEYDKNRLDKVLTDNLPNASNVTRKGSFSLHSKVMIFDNDIYIGSSNAEFRSYMMDTNNGVFIKDAPEIVAQYKQSLEQLVAKKIVVEAKASLQFDDLMSLQRQEKEDMEALKKRYALEQRSSIKNRPEELQYTLFQLYETLHQLSKEMNTSLKKKELKGRSQLDELLKVF